MRSSILVLAVVLVGCAGLSAPTTSQPQTGFDFGGIEGIWEGSGNYGGINGFFIEADIRGAPLSDGQVATVHYVSISTSDPGTVLCDGTWTAVDVQPLEYEVRETLTGLRCPAPDGNATIRVDPFRGELSYQAARWDAQANLTRTSQD